MEPLNDNIHKESRTNKQKALDEKMQKAHTDDLGLGIPEGYFSKSKSEILEKVGPEDKSRVVPLYGNKLFWAAAAAIALLIVITVFQTSSEPQINEIPMVVTDTLEQLDEGLANEDFQSHESDILINSLFVEDTEIDELVDNYMLEGAWFDESDIN